MTNKDVLLIALAVLIGFSLLQVFNDANDLHQDFQAYQSRPLLDDYNPQQGAHHDEHIR